MCHVLVFNQVLYAATVKKYDKFPLLIVHILAGNLIYSCFGFLNKSIEGGDEKRWEKQREKAQTMLEKEKTL